MERLSLARQWLQEAVRPYLEDRESKAQVEQSVAATFCGANFPEATDAELRLRRQHWAQLLYRFQKYGHFSTGNRVGALEGGDECFPQMLSAIASAKTRVWCESYIFDNSPVAEMVFQHLKAAAARKVDVVLLVDFIGSFTLRNDWVKELRQAGADVVFFNPVLPAHLCVGPISFRDHRKILISDEVGFCGGMNIQEEVGEEIYGTSRFYDVHAKLEGPCVADLAEVFRDSLEEAGGQVVRGPISPPAPLENGIYVQILQSNVRKRRRTLQKVIVKSIDAAQDSLMLTTAYFFPPTFLKAALLRVPARNTSMSLLLSGSSDFYPLPGDLLAQMFFLRGFLSATLPSQDRVSVHLYEKRHMHAKHMCVDGVFSTIGSFNFDLYSARRNLEVGVAVFDRSFALQLQQMHQNRVKESRRTFFSDWVYHQPLIWAACGIAYSLLRFSSRNVFDGLDCYQRKWLMRKASLTFLLEEQSAQFVATSMMWGLE